MTPTSKPLIALIVFAAAFTAMSFTSNTKKKAPRTAKPKIQAAILLDVSNSMDGLIEQAKAQLWNMVSVMASDQILAADCRYSRGR